MLVAAAIYTAVQVRNIRCADRCVYKTHHAVGGYYSEKDKHCICLVPDESNKDRVELNVLPVGSDYSETKQPELHHYAWEDP